MPTPKEIFLAVVLPGILSLVVLAIFWLRKGNPTKALLGTGAALATTIAFATAFFVRLGKAGFEPRDAQNWLLLIAGVVLVVSLIPLWRNWFLGTLAMLAMTFFAVWRIVSFKFLPGGDYSDSAARGFALIGAAALAITVLWLMLRPFAKQKTLVSPIAAPEAPAEATSPLTSDADDRFALPLALFIAFMGTGAVIAFQGSQDIGMITNSLGAAMGSATIVALFRRGTFALGPAGLAAALALFAAVLTAGYNLAELRDLPAILLMVAPLLAWTVKLPRVRNLPWWAKAVVTVIAVGIPVGLAVFPAQQAFFAKPAESGYGY